MFNKFPLIIIDESTDARISEALKTADFRILCIQEVMPGTDDIDIIQVAAERSIYFN